MQSNLEELIYIFETVEILEIMKIVGIVVELFKMFKMLKDRSKLELQVLYVCRNVKDAAVSYYHHETLMKSHDLQSDFVTYAR